MLGRVSIRILLPLLMGLPVAVAALVLVGLWSGNARQSARTLNASEMAQIHARINERLGTLLRMPGRATALQREAILSGRLNPDDPRSWHDPLFDLTRAMDMLSGVTWGNAQGHAAWVYRYPGKPHPELAISDERTVRDGSLAIEEFSLDDSGNVIEQIGGYAYDPRTRPWYTGAVEAGKPTFLEPYAWVNGDGRATTLGLPFVEPVFDREGSNLIGVLAAEFSLQDLSDFLRTLRVGQAGFVLILDAHGHLIAHSLPAGDVPAALFIDGVPTAPMAAEMDDPRVRELSGVVDSALSASAGGATAVPVEGEPMLVRVSAFGSLPGLDWRIITAVPEVELLAPVAAARASSHRATLVAVLATILLGLGAGLLATMPVRRLVREIRRVGQGELDERVRPEPSSELRQIAEAVNAMAEDLRDRVRVRESLLVAMEVQKNLLPQEAPTVAGLDIAGHSTYCDETGGDYYDYLDVQPLGGQQAGQSRVALAIGDVMGHGVAAAMLMATARGILRSRCDEPASLGELLTHLNELLVGDTGGKRFMTMLLVMLDGDTGAMAWASAGHDPPMVYLAKDDRFAEFDGGGMPLGLFAGQAYETDTEGPFAPGDVVVLSTDGLWEARTTEGEFYGKQRLEALIREHAGGTAETIAAAIRADHLAACGESSQDDDITFVVAKIKGP